MPATDAVLVRHRLSEELATRDWLRLARAFITANGPQGRDQRPAHNGAAELVPWMYHPEPMVREYARAVEMAHTYYVAPTMLPLVDAKADAWADDDQWSLDDLPTAAGLMYVPTGIADLGIDGHPVSCDVVLWHVVGGRLRVMEMFTKQRVITERSRYNIGDADWEALPSVHPLMVYDLDPGEVPSALVLDRPLPQEMRGDIRVWLEHDRMDGSITERAEKWLEENGARLERRPDRILCWMFSALRLMRSTLPAVEVTREGIPANLRKRLVTRRKLKNLHVTVIEYRRREPSARLGGTHEYSHRFLRREHTRRVWYRDPETREWRQRTVTIPATVVLADRTDLPLLLRDHVNSLSR